MIVHWIDGTEENCCPNNIELIPEDPEYSISLEMDTEALSWETESEESVTDENIDKTTLQNLATSLEFIRGRITYMKKVFKEHTINENFSVRILIVR